MALSTHFPDVFQNTEFPVQRECIIEGKSKRGGRRSIEGTKMHFYNNECLCSLKFKFFLATYFTFALEICFNLTFLMVIPLYNGGKNPHGDNWNLNLHTFVCRSLHSHVSNWYLASSCGELLM